VPDNKTILYKHKPHLKTKENTKDITMHLPGDVSAENNAVTLQELLYVVISFEKGDIRTFLSQWSVHSHLFTSPSPAKM
jgi:hypothetical protein